MKFCCILDRLDKLRCMPVCKQLLSVEISASERVHSCLLPSMHRHSIVLVVAIHESTGQNLSHLM